MHNKRVPTTGPRRLLSRHGESVRPDRSRRAAAGVVTTFLPQRLSERPVSVVGTPDRLREAVIWWSGCGNTR
jgi:hypothetical protein